MKNIKKLLLMFSLLGMFILGACSSIEVIAEQINPIKVWPQNENGSYNTLLVVDEDTGVNYIVISGKIYGNGIGVGITPRLNKDGSLYTNK